MSRTRDGWKGDPRRAMHAQCVPGRPRVVVDRSTWLEWFNQMYDVIAASFEVTRYQRESIGQTASARAHGFDVVVNRLRAAQERYGFLEDSYGSPEAHHG